MRKAIIGGSVSAKKPIIKVLFASGKSLLGFCLGEKAISEVLSRWKSHYWGSVWAKKPNIGVLSASEKALLGLWLGKEGIIGVLSEWGKPVLRYCLGTESHCWGFIKVRKAIIWVLSGEDKIFAVPLARSVSLVRSKDMFISPPLCSKNGRIRHFIYFFLGILKADWWSAQHHIYFFIMYHHIPLRDKSGPSNLW